MTQALSGGSLQKENIWSRIEQYKPVYVEPRNKHEFLTAMENFYERIRDPAHNGAVFAAVCRGKVRTTHAFSLGGKWGEFCGNAAAGARQCLD